MISSIVRTRFSGQDLLTLVVFVFNIEQIRVLRGSPEIKEPSPLKTRNQRKRRIEDTASGNEETTVLHDHHVSVTKVSLQFFEKLIDFFIFERLMLRFC